MQSGNIATATRGAGTLENHAESLDARRGAGAPACRVGTRADAVFHTSPCPEPGPNNTHAGAVFIPILACRPGTRTRRWASCVLGLAVAAGVTAIPATAGILSSARTVAGCVDPIGFVQDPVSCELHLAGNVASATVTLLPLPSVLVTTFSPVGSGNRARANAGVTYFFQVIGGNAGDIVPIGITATLEAHSRTPDNPRGYAQANLATFTRVDGLASGASVCTYSAICQSFISSFSGTILRNATSGAVGEFVNFTAEASATGTGAESDEFASAFVDPYIFIDPAFPNASLYSIVVSPDVGNQPPAATPEPATLWLAGIAIAALLLRK